jgi:hypothetical protein
MSAVRFRAGRKNLLEIQGIDEGKMISQGMDESKDAVARVFITLSKKGLRKSRVSICDLYSFDSPITAQNRAEWRDLNSLFEDVMGWLENEQAIYIGIKATTAVGLTCFEGVQLSAKGAAIVERDEIANLIVGSPASPHSSSTNHDSSGNMQKIGELIGSVLAAFSKTMASP